MAGKTSNPKRERFINVASRRVQKVLDSLDSLAKCANRNNYDFSEEEVAKMIKAIKDKTKGLESAYMNNAKSTKNTFKF
jgi:hypothetical protein